MDTEFAEIVRQENATGKIYVRGYDRHGRALVYMHPARENTHHEGNNLRHLVWNIEKAVVCTARKSLQRGSDKPLEKINLLIDYHGFRLRDAPPMSTSRKTLDILQKCYPECLHKAYILDPPWVFRTFWTLIKPFVDPVTKRKVVFCTGKAGLQQLLDDVGGDANLLEPIAGGTNPVEFDSVVYMQLPLDEAFDEPQG
jgi:CRAL/TRIO domain